MHKSCYFNEYLYFQFICCSGFKYIQTVLNFFNPGVVACVAAGLRTRLNHLYSIEGFKCLRRKQRSHNTSSFTIVSVSVVLSRSVDKSDFKFLLKCWFNDLRGKIVDIDKHLLPYGTIKC